jgi:hypothetical protein
MPNVSFGSRSFNLYHGPDTGDGSTYGLLGDNVLVGGGSGRAGGLLHGHSVGVPGVLLGLGLDGGGLEEVEVEHGDC